MLAQATTLSTISSVINVFAPYISTMSSVNSALACSWRQSMTAWRKAVDVGVILNFLMDTFGAVRLGLMYSTVYRVKDSGLQIAQQSVILRSAGWQRLQPSVDVGSQSKWVGEVLPFREKKGSVYHHCNTSANTYFGSHYQRTLMERHAGMTGRVHVS